MRLAESYLDESCPFRILTWVSSPFPAPSRNFFPFVEEGNSSLPIQLRFLPLLLLWSGVVGWMLHFFFFWFCFVLFGFVGIFAGYLGCRVSLW